MGVGIWIYQRYMTSWRYRELLVTNNLVLSGLYLLDSAMFARVNLAWGVPDHAFIIGTSIMEFVISTWLWMPQVVIYSYMCPKGMEAIMYALLAGCSNLGDAISQNVGAMLLDQLGCSPSGAFGESSQFANLWKASIISTMLPFGTIALIFW